MGEYESVSKGPSKAKTRFLCLEIYLGIATIVIAVSVVSQTTQTLDLIIMRGHHNQSGE